MRLKVAVTMPVFNEEAGIIQFLEELRENLSDYDLSIVIVDDSSTDLTARNIKDFKRIQPQVNLTLIENEINLGHGPSTLKGMAFALTVDADAVLTVDGDGQFLGNEMRCALDTFFSSKADVLEGVRVKRSEPFFRKISTGAVKILVWSRSHKVPADGNTPLRIYQSRRLLEIVSGLPSNLLIPNVFISTYSRIQDWNLFEMKVTSIPSRGNDALGSTWKQRYAHLPSKRFLKFCLTAFLQWQKTKIPTERYK
jgi:glycosyltransferase involved in cell wall biosynthesis